MCVCYSSILSLSLTLAKVIDPLRGSICRANKPCTVTWLDDGRAPLLSSIGVSTVGLYKGSDVCL